MKRKLGLFENLRYSVNKADIVIHFYDNPLPNTFVIDHLSTLNYVLFLRNFYGLQFPSQLKGELCPSDDSNLNI